MKTLYLIRHGHAESKAKYPDISRNLDEEGKEEVRATASKMKSGGILPALILSSHANRAYQTAEIVAETIGYKLANIHIEADIYNTDTDILEHVVSRQGNEYPSLLIAGHNPVISWFASSMGHEVKDMMPTAGLVAFEVDIADWASFKPNKARFLFHIFGS